MQRILPPFLASLALALLGTLLASGTGAALAHAGLAASEPAPDTTATAPLDEVRLVFDEAVELGFSRFEVHRLEADDVDVSDEDAWRRLAVLAGVLVSDVLDGRAADGERVDAGLANGERRTEEVVIELREDLAPGVYVAMWRVLAVDTHATQGFLVFEYAPEGQP